DRSSDVFSGWEINGSAAFARRGVNCFSNSFRVHSGTFVATTIFQCIIKLLSLYPHAHRGYHLPQYYNSFLYHYNLTFIDFNFFDCATRLPSAYTVNPFPFPYLLPSASQ